MLFSRRCVIIYRRPNRLEPPCPAHAHRGWHVPGRVRPAARRRAQGPRLVRQGGRPGLAVCLQGLRRCPDQGPRVDQGRRRPSGHLPRRDEPGRPRKPRGHRQPGPGAHFCAVTGTLLLLFFTSILLNVKRWVFEFSRERQVWYPRSLIIGQCP